MRIIGGIAGGRRLSAPKGLSVRPTPDLVRQAVFNSLGERVSDAEVLDLFSGTGALGLECLSRGAKWVTSVEKSSDHARYIRANVRDLELPADRHELRVQEAFAAMRSLVSTGARRYDLIMADPPFGPKTKAGRSSSLSQQLADAAETATLLKPGGLLVLGHARRDEVVPSAGWDELRVLTHGDSVFRLLRIRAAASTHESFTDVTPPTETSAEG
ncbi:MAG: RsmD family RNA methyltransferase [Verrucomicrobiales bacterium]|nr:RsmD family RNA methyltransferase [Verrucomicrobiales bacterium]